MENTLDVIRYWQTSLIDSELIYPLNLLKDGKMVVRAFQKERIKDFNDIELWIQKETNGEFSFFIEERPIDVSFESIKNGIIGDIATKQLVAQYIALLEPTKDNKWNESKLVKAKRFATWLKNSEITKKEVDTEATQGSQDKKDVEDFLNILIGLYRYRQPIENQSTKNSRIRFEIIPLWIPARIDKNGCLFPNSDKTPFVPREFLDPQTKSSETMLGSLEQVNRYIEKHYSDKIYDSWGNFFKYCDDYLKAARKNYESIVFQEQNKALILIDLKDTNPAKHILKHLDYYKNNNIPELLKRYCNSQLGGNLRKDIITIPPIEGCKNHVAQMSDEFPLFPTQRKALHYALTLKNGKILAVNGPPGTGKTTLIHSIMASMWVAAAYKGKNPPVMVVSSSNNQAITNAIDSFERVFKPKDDLFTKRWLPDIKSYGLYMLSNSKLEGEKGKEIKEKYHYVDFHNNGFPTQVEEEMYVKKAEAYFSKKFSEYYGRPLNSINDAVLSLHNEIKIKVDKIQTLIKDGNELKKTYRNLRKKFKAINDELLDQAQERWVKEISNNIKNLESESDNIQETKIKPLEECKQELEFLKTEFQKECNPLQQTKLTPQNKSYWKSIRDFLWKILKGFFQTKQPQFITYHKDFFVKYNMSRYRPGLEKWDESVFTEKYCSAIIENAIVEIENKLSELREKLEKNQKSIEEYRNEKVRESILYDDYIKESNIYKKKYPNINLDTPDWDSDLDKNLRFEAFILATHYWEARWLQDTKKLIENDELNRKRKSQAKGNKELRFRRYTMLTPGLVSTLYMLPTFISYYTDNMEIPLNNYIDLLFIDEAGQVAPEIASAAFGLAKKAVVLGDVYQLEPVWSIYEKVDIGNLMANKIITKENEFQQFRDTFRAVSNGNAMGIARNVCEVTDNEEKGILLAQHTRCEKEIIEICNDLVYGGRIEPCKKQEKPKGSLPPLVYYHINGKSVRIGHSRFNRNEVAAIIEWLINYKEKIEKVYSGKEKKEIHDIVGIVTPFAMQARIIKERLPEELSQIVVGTVHSLQGAEREIVLFSTVYTSNDGIMQMFNKKPNLINVAISRARACFMIFGDIEILKKNPWSNTGKLGKHILKDCYNWNNISDWHNPDN